MTVALARVAAEGMDGNACYLKHLRGAIRPTQ